MKFKITFKDPDGVSDKLMELAENSIDAADISDRAKEVAIENKIEDFKRFLRTWITYSEYVTIEFDTEANTARVVESGS
jgi:hypothetical protein